VDATLQESSVVSAVGQETSLSGQCSGGQLKEAVQLQDTFFPDATHSTPVKRRTWPMTDYECLLNDYESLKLKISLQGWQIISSRISRKFHFG